MFATGHPAGLTGIFGYGGWWAIPAALCVGLVLAAVFHGARWVLDETVGAPTRGAPVRVVAPFRRFGHGMPGFPGSRRSRRAGRVAVRRTEPLTPTRSRVAEPLRQRPATQRRSAVTNTTSWRRGGLAAIAVIAAAALLPASAGAHAIVGPSVSLSGKLQLYSLAVPTEKEGLTTSKIVLTVPPGFGIDSFVPPPSGWTQNVHQTGSGDNAVVTKVTWAGGKTHRRGLAVPVPRRTGLGEDVHVPGAADVLRRVDRHVVGTRVRGRAGSGD